MEIDPLDLIVTLAEESLHDLTDQAVESSAALDELFARGIRTDAPEYSTAVAEKDEALNRLRGASHVVHVVQAGVAAYRRLRGEDPHSVDVERWRKLTTEGLKKVVLRGTDAVALHRAMNDLLTLGRDKPQ